METILITGGSGFLGRELALQLRDRATVVLGARDNALNRSAEATTGCKAIPLDVARIDSVRDAVIETNPGVIIHAAATKYVDLSEGQPFECIDVNVVGSENVARIAMDRGVKVVVGVSTDKAAPPAGNIYGQSKALMERMFSAVDGRAKTKFTCVRFGNIAWSTGSVFPIWRRMLDTSGVIGSTGPKMRRFFFTVDEAAALVVRAIDHIERVRGSVLSQRMKAAQISDVLEVLTERSGGRWEKIASRPGDKVDEFLVAESEVAWTESLTIDGVEHFLTSFTRKPERPILHAVSSANALRLSRTEIARILDAAPNAPASG